MSGLEIALWIAVGLVIAAAVLVALAIAGLLGLAAYAEARADDARPDPVDEHAATAVVEDQGDVTVLRAQPWTGDTIGEHPLVAGAHALYDAYRRGEDLGGARELSPLSQWTGAAGWAPIRDWRFSRTDKRWWS